MVAVQVKISSGSLVPAMRSGIWTPAVEMTGYGARSEGLEPPTF